jgi:hypothetical protein
MRWSGNSGDNDLPPEKRAPRLVDTPGIFKGPGTSVLLVVGVSNSAGNAILKK